MARELQPIVIGPDGSVRAIAPGNGTTFSLEEIQAVVGGYFELHALRDGRLMALNEDGIMFGLPKNAKAQAILTEWRAPGPHLGHVLGFALLCPQEMIP